MLLQHLVGKVDTKLLERIMLEDLEPENIENPNIQISVARKRLAHGSINPIDQPVKPSVRKKAEISCSIKKKDRNMLAFLSATH